MADWGSGFSGYGVGGALGAAAAQIGLAYAKPRQTSRNVGGQGSDMDALMRRLMSSMGGSALPSQSQIESQARSTVDLQFDPQIAAIKRAMNQAKSNEAYSKVAVGKLFEGLAQSYGTDKKNTKAMFKQAKEQEKARLQDYTNETKANYQDSMNSLAESYKRLGIEAAAGDSTTGQLAKDQAFNVQQATDQSNIEQGALNQEQTGELNYWEKGMGTARMEGTQRQADLDMMLQQYLQENTGKLEDLKAQREAAYQSAITQLQQQVQQQAAAQANDTWNKLLQLGRFQMDVGNYNQKLQNQSANYGKGLSGASKYLYDQFVNSQWGPGEADRYSSLLQGIILQLPSGITPEQAASIAAQEANRRGVSASVMSRAMLAYYGRL